MSKNSKPATAPVTMEKITASTVEAITKLRTDIFQSAKKVANSATSFIGLPKSGTFSTIGVMIYTKNSQGGINPEIPAFLMDSSHVPNKDIYLYSLGLTTVEGGFISESALTAQMLKPELTTIKSGENSGNFTLKSERVTNWDNETLGYSANERLKNLEGKSFETEPVTDARVWQQKVLQNWAKQAVVTQNTPEKLQTLLDKTETKNLYKFSLV